MSEELPPPTPEGELIRRAREAYLPRLSIRAAAEKIGLSVENWGYIERGYQQSGRGKPVRRAVPTAQTLAQMAFAVEVAPEELDAVGRRDAGDVLREILRRQRARTADERHEELLDRVAAVEAYFRDPTVPAEERQQRAARLLKLLPFYAVGQEPPPGLLDDDPPPPGKDSKRSA